MENPAKPESSGQTPETGPKPEVAAEVTPAAGEQIKPAAPTPPPKSDAKASEKAAPPAPAQSGQTAPPPASPGPALADDVDVIEKEWVDKAQAIVKATEGDPHAEEDQVEDLQYDYLKKRYGIDVKSPEEK